MESFESFGKTAKGQLDRAIKNFPISPIGQGNPHTNKPGKLTRTPYEENGVLYGDVETTNLKGEPIFLKKVKIAQNKSGVNEPLNVGKQISVLINAEDDLTRLDTSNMVIEPKATTPNYRNDATPANLLSKFNPQDLLRAPNGVCLSLQRAKNEFEVRKRQLYARDSLVTIQHPNSIKSGGISIDPTGKGNVSMFNKDGTGFQQDETGTVFNSKDVDTTTASNSRNSIFAGGLPSREFHEVRDIVPTSNVFTPVPSAIPSIIKIVRLIGTARMIINVARIAKEGWSELKRIQKDIRSLPDDSDSTYTSDKNETNKLKKISQTRQMIHQLKMIGDEEGASKLEKELNILINYDTSQREAKQIRKIENKKKFDAIVNDASNTANRIKNDYLTPGGKGQQELDKIPLFGQQGNPNIGNPNANSFKVGAGPRPPSVGLPYKGAIDETIVSTNATNPRNI